VVKSIRVKGVGHITNMGEMKMHTTFQSKNPNGKAHLGRSGDKEEDHIKMDVKETLSKGVNWIHLAQDGFQWWALVNTATNLRVP
jgi:hypothetical protein